MTLSKHRKGKERVEQNQGEITKRVIEWGVQWAEKKNRKVKAMGIKRKLMEDGVRIEMEKE